MPRRQTCIIHTDSSFAWSQQIYSYSAVSHRMRTNEKYCNYNLAFLTCVISTSFKLGFLLCFPFNKVREQSEIVQLYIQNKYSNIFSQRNRCMQSDFRRNRIILPVAVGKKFKPFKNHYHSPLVCFFLTVSSRFLVPLLPNVESVHRLFSILSLG